MLTKKEQVWGLLKDDPMMGTAEIAKRLKMSRRHVRTAKQGLKGDQLPRILVLDIETSPLTLLSWGLFKQRPNIDQVVKTWGVLSWAAKWLFEDTVMGEVVTGEEANRRDDWRVLEEIWHLVDEADILVGQNIQRFDMRKLNWRWILNGKKRPSSYQVIDTLKVSQRHFASESHKLDWLGQYLVNKKKIRTDYELWKRCVNEEGFTTEEDQEAALQEMLVYNKNDVLLTEEVYLELRPWVVGHPNLNLYLDIIGEKCTNCLKDLKEKHWQGYYVTPANRYRSFRCDCGAQGRSRNSDIVGDKRKNLVVGVAR